MITRENVIATLKKYWFLLGVVVLLLIVTIAYCSGLRISSTGGIVRAGSISIERVPAGTVIYVDESHQQKVKGESSTMNVLPGTHSVIVDAAGFQPWNELVTVTEGEVSLVRPLLVAKEIQEQDIPTESLAEASRAIALSALPTQNAPLLLSEGCVAVYVAGNRIVATPTNADGCTPAPYLCTEKSIEEFGACLPTIIFEPGEALRGLIAYPGRSDALILASSNIAYIIELDPREPRFFAPIPPAKGTDIRIAPWSDTSILIRHGFQITEVPL